MTARIVPFSETSEYRDGDGTVAPFCCTVSGNDSRAESGENTPSATAIVSWSKRTEPAIVGGGKNGVVPFTCGCVSSYSPPPGSYPSACRVKVAL